MGNTKEKILNAARELFNELGYSQVTIRKIASALGMSSGNLNYHFRTREEILERLYFQMVAEFDARIEGLDLHSFALEDIHRDMKESMLRMVDYRFFWTDLYNLLSQNAKIKAHFVEARVKRVEGYRFLFLQLKERGMLTEPQFSSEYEFLTQRMIDYSNTWLYASILYGDEAEMEVQVDRAANVLFSMLYPYLSDLGREQFPQIAL